MSGGSYNYLYMADGLVGLLEKRHDLESMAKRLVDMSEDEFPGVDKVAADTVRLVNLLSTFDDVVTELVEEKLTNVWHAVEWFDSNDDYGEEQQIRDALKGKKS